MKEPNEHPYSTETVMKTVNKLLKLAEQENLHPAVFLHSLIFASELMIMNYQFIPKQIAEIRRQSRKVIEELEKEEEAKEKK